MRKKLSNISFTIVVPLYNEVESLPHTGEVLKTYLHRHEGHVSVLFVDDGSVDGSDTLLKKLCQNEGMDYIRFETNRGLSSALKAGFDCVTTPWVGYIDADLQTTPEDFDKLLPYTDEYDAVVGYRAHRKDTLSKRLQSRLGNTVRRWMVNDGIIDTGCPLKLIRTDLARRIPFFDGMHRFIPALIQLEGGRIRQVPVRHFERRAGRSKFNLFNRSYQPILDLFAYRWMKARYIRYTIIDSSKRYESCR